MTIQSSMNMRLGRNCALRRELTFDRRALIMSCLIKSLNFLSNYGWSWLEDEVYTPPLSFALFPLEIQTLL